MDFVKALPVTDLPPGRSQCVKLGGTKIALFNYDGDLLAIDDTCSHEDASLSEGVMRRDEKGRCTVECPYHGALFELHTGTPLTLPAVVPVRTYRVRVQGDMIEVEV